MLNRRKTAKFSESVPTARRALGNDQKFLLGRNSYNRYRMEFRKVHNRSTRSSKISIPSRYLGALRQIRGEISAGSDDGSKNGRQCLVTCYPTAIAIRLEKWHRLKKKFDPKKKLSSGTGVTCALIFACFFLILLLDDS